MSTEFSIERAELRHIAEIAPPFDAYRRFYDQGDDPRARSFLEERVAHHESVVFVARLQGAAEKLLCYILAMQASNGTAIC